MDTPKSQNKQSRATKTYYNVIAYIGVMSAFMMVIGTSVLCMAHGHRQIMLENYATITLVAKTDDKLKSETINIETSNDEQSKVRAYHFADGEIIAIRDTDFQTNAKYVNAYDKIIPYLKGTDIKRRFNKDDGSDVLYRLAKNVVYTLPNGHTVRYDQVASVTDARANVVIDNDYKNLKKAGILIWISIIATIFCITALIVPSLPKMLRKNKASAKKTEKGSTKNPRAK